MDNLRIAHLSEGILGVGEAVAFGAYALGARTVFGQDLATRIHQLFLFSPLFSALVYVGVPRISKREGRTHVYMQSVLTTATMCLLTFLGRWEAQNGQGLGFAKAFMAINVGSHFIGSICFGYAQIWAWHNDEAGEEAIKQVFGQQSVETFTRCGLSPIPIFRILLEGVLETSLRGIELWNCGTSPLQWAGLRSAMLAIKAGLFLSMEMSRFLKS